MSFEFLFSPMQELDAWLGGPFEGAPLLIVLGLSVALGLRHASDPDHLVAVTSLVAADGGDTRGALRLGAWWGLGHAAMLLALGLPLIALDSELPGWIGAGAEVAVGVVIVLLAVRVTWNWIHRREEDRVRVRAPGEAFTIGLLHGLAGTGAVVVVLLAAVPTQLEAATALAVFAPMSIVSMAALTGGLAWLLTRPSVEPLYRRGLIPALGVFGLAFGLWYAGLV